MTQKHTPGPWVYILSEEACADNDYHTLWTVGFYAPDGKWHSDSDHHKKEDASYRAAFLNGGVCRNAAVNSYGKHCLDPVAAAEGDLLGQMKEAFSDLLKIASTNDILDVMTKEQKTAAHKARAILAQCKGN